MKPVSLIVAVLSLLFSVCLFAQESESPETQAEFLEKFVSRTIDNALKTIAEGEIEQQIYATEFVAKVAEKLPKDDERIKQIQSALRQAIRKDILLSIPVFSRLHTKHVLYHEFMDDWQEITNRFLKDVTLGEKGEVVPTHLLVYKAELARRKKTGEKQVGPEIEGAITSEAIMRIAYLVKQGTLTVDQSILDDLAEMPLPAGLRYPVSVLLLESGDTRLLKEYAKHYYEHGIYDDYIERISHIKFKSDETVQALLNIRRGNYHLPRVIEVGTQLDLDRLPMDEKMFHRATEALKTYGITVSTVKLAPAAK